MRFNDLSTLDRITVLVLLLIGLAWFYPGAALGCVGLALS